MTDLFLLDLRYAARKLLRTPGFTGIAVLTLAIAIGANTAIFSVINGVLLKPLPFADPDRVVRVATLKDGKRNPSSPLDFSDIRAQSKSYSAISVLDNASMNLSGVGGEPERLNAARVSASFFALLGVAPARGRGFAPKEDERGAGHVVVLSDGLWKRRFGSDPRIVGQTITLDGSAYTVVGIARAGFDYPARSDVWVPLVFSTDDLDPSNRGAHWLGVVARLAPGVTVEQANREATAITRHLEQQYPQSNTGFGAAVIPLQTYMVGDVKPALLVLLGAVGFVLLIGCANVANLLLVRAAARESEMAVRAALGAGRGRIVRQLMTESILLALLGGALGSVLAAWGVDLLVRIAPQNLPRLAEVSVDGRVLGYTAAVALVTGIVFGLVPALHAYRANVSGMLREGSRGVSANRGSGRVRGALVVSEMALAVVLLIGAGLLVRSFTRLLSVDPGFRAERVVSYNVSLSGDKYSSPVRLRAVTDGILSRMGAMPGVQSAGVIMGRPLGEFNARTVMHITGTPQETPADRKLSMVSLVSPGYFATMGIPLLRGRDFGANDRSGAPMVAVVNREFVRRYFPHEDPIGKHIELGWSQDTTDTKGAPQARLGGEIVGVVGDVKRQGLADEVLPETYASIEQAPINDFSVVVRSTAEFPALAGAIRAQVRQVDPDLPIYELQQLSEAVSQSVARPRFYMTLLASFAGIAVLLAAIGIYGVISYTVSQRTRELGIRIALGATNARVVRLVLGQGVTLAVTGAVIGLAGAAWVTRVMSSLLFGVRAVDPATFTLVGLGLVAVAGLACLVPARRAARVDPLAAMRE